VERQEGKVSDVLLLVHGSPKYALQTTVCMSVGSAALDGPVQRARESLKEPARARYARKLDGKPAQNKSRHTQYSHLNLSCCNLLQVSWCQPIVIKKSKKQVRYTQGLVGSYQQRTPSSASAPHFANPPPMFLAPTLTHAPIHCPCRSMPQRMSSPKQPKFRAVPSPLRRRRRNQGSTVSPESQSTM
jgi:hypothetical protein